MGTATVSRAKPPGRYGSIFRKHAASRDSLIPILQAVQELEGYLSGESIAAAVLYCGTHSGRTVDKFAATGLTPLEGSIVRPPLIGECVANFECRLAGSLETGDHTIFAGEVVACWITDAPERVVRAVAGGVSHAGAVHDHHSRNLQSPQDFQRA